MGYDRTGCFIGFFLDVLYLYFFFFLHLYGEFRGQISNKGVYVLYKNCSGITQVCLVGQRSDILNQAGQCITTRRGKQEEGLKQHHHRSCKVRISSQFAPVLVSAELTV